MQKIVCTTNGFALTDFLAKQTKLHVVRAGPLNLQNASTSVYKIFICIFVRTLALKSLFFSL